MSNEQRRTPDPSIATAPLDLDEIRFDEHGLVPVVTQDASSGEVLMLAYADREAVTATLATLQAHYHSRSRDELWRKGATSGNVQDVVEVRLDCDSDALLYRVRQTGSACHTGARSCFYRASSEAAPEAAPLTTILGTLERVVDDRLDALPEASYVTALHRRGLGYVAQKVIEEAGESAVAALEHKDGELVGEAADLVFHLTVLLRERGVAWADVARKLAERHAASPERS